MMEKHSPPGQAPSTTKGPSSLTLKINTVLSTSYVDSEFRDALSLLDQRGFQNTAKERRQLRLGLQREVIDGNGEIISDFGRVADQLRRIQNTLEQLNASYADMRKSMAAVHDESLPALSEATSLMTQRSNVAARQSTLEIFRSRFTLTYDETIALTSTAVPVDDFFFSALAKAKRISKECEILLGFENQKLGSELMEQTSKSLNLAFQKLYKWVQKVFRTLNLENPQLNTSIRRAVRALAERPSLFQSCLDFFADARQRTLSDAFHLALTGTSTTGRPDPSVKPIEMAAHDSLRYVGDMLAWIHSAAVGEREALEVLFLQDGDEIARGLQSGRADHLWKLIQDTEDGDSASDFDALRALHDLVDRDVSVVSRNLRQRVEQVIQANEETILAYQLANLLGFYRFTFAKLLGENASLLEMMTSLESEALRQFRSLVRDHISVLQREFQQTPSDLGPPIFLSDALEQLTVIMQTYDASLSASNDREADFQPILTEAFEPFISGCESMAKGISPQDGVIFLLNCLVSAISTLSCFEFTRERTETLKRRVEAESNKLMDTQYYYLRIESGLDQLLDTLANVSPHATDIRRVRSLGPMQPEALALASQKLDDFLPSALMDAMDNVQHLQDSKLARSITEEAADRFCRDFEKAEAVLVSLDHQATDHDIDGEEPLVPFRTLFPRTTGEIRVLLS